MYIEVAPAVPLSSGRQVFTYTTQKKVQAGTIVTVPFGRQTTSAIVITEVKRPPYPTKAVKKIFPVALTSIQLALGTRIATMAGGGLGYTLRMFFPASLTSGTKGRKKNGGQHLIVIPERWMTERYPTAVAYHAGLSTKTKNMIWHEIASGSAITVVGTQKALFLPWKKLMTITVEDAQLPTHKLWDQYPRGDNRRLARMLAEESGAKLHENMFDSSLTLNPKILELSINDQRKGFVIPTALVHDLHEWTRQKEHILILHNQKQSSVAKALVILKLNRKNIFLSTTALFTQVKDEKFDRVIWMFPESALSFPDFRSRERALFLLARLNSLLKSRRKVVVVTRHKDRITDAMIGNLGDIFKEILTERKKYMYPPFSDMVRLTFKDKTKDKARKRAEGARLLLDKKIKAPNRVLGPYQSLEKDKKTKIHEQHILLFGQLKALTKAYTGLKADIVDVDPERVL